MILFPEGTSKFGFESHLAMGVTSETSNIVINGVATEVELEMETILGLYMRAEFFSADNLGFYGLLGYSASQTGPGFTAGADESASGVSYGLGTTYFLSKTFTLQFEILQVQSGKSDTDFEVSSISLGLNIPI